jgi:hypothetical protein
MDNASNSANPSRPKVAPDDQPRGSETSGAGNARVTAALVALAEECRRMTANDIAVFADVFEAVHAALEAGADPPEVTALLQLHGRTLHE